jgi:dCTP deaminase
VILTDREIQSYLSDGLIEIKPSPSLDAYASTSVDLRLGDFLHIFKERTPGVEAAIDPTVAGYDVRELINRETDKLTIPTDGYVLKGKTLVLGWTKESINLCGKGRVAARVEGKSSLARIGLAVHVTAPTIHAGFAAASIQLEIINHGPLPIRIKAGMAICQLIFEQTSGIPEKEYKSQFSGQAP